MKQSKKGSAPDEIREWISDHLLYVIIGAIALVIILVVIFSVRACKKGKSGTDERTGTITTSTESNAGTSTAGSETIQHPLTQASSDVRSLIETYYQALGDKDIDTLRSVVMNLPADDESRVINSKGYIEGYRVQDIYTKEGLTENSYVVYACVDYVFRDIETAYPALSQLYVLTDSDGSLKIAGDSDVLAIGDADYSSYMSQLESDSDFLQLKSRVQEANSKALASDSALQEFAAGLGTAVSDPGATPENGESSEPVTEVEPQDNGETRVTTDGVNVRSEPNSDSDNIVSFAEEGTTVRLTGEEIDGWYGVVVDGIEGYIYGDFLQ